MLVSGEAVPGVGAGSLPSPVSIFPVRAGRRLRPDFGVHPGGLPDGFHEPLLAVVPGIFLLQFEIVS